ncbi:hypothetical protein [Streptomyces sp. NPDC001970]
MARFGVVGEELVVRLAWWEKAVVRRWKVSVPLAAVESVTVLPEWWRLLRGIPGRRLVVPGAVCLGTWEHRGEDFLAIRPRHPAVVCVDLRAPSPFVRIAVSSPHPERMASMIRSAMNRARHRP